MQKQINSISDHKKLETHIHNTWEQQNFDVHTASRQTDGSIWTECHVVYGWGQQCQVCCTAQQDNWILHRMPSQWWLACNGFKVRLRGSSLAKFSLWTTHTVDYITNNKCHITLLTVWKSFDNGFKIILKYNVSVTDIKHDQR